MSFPMSPIWRGPRGLSTGGTVITSYSIHYTKLYDPATNLTAGTGGVGAAYTAADYERAIRHGIDREGRPLMIMPSLDFSHLTDQDVARA